MLNSVIVVDDEASIRLAVEQWLSLSGFSVQLFSRAEECLAQLPANFPGVIISDVRMPGLGGLELLARVRALDPDLPVILLTGHGDVPMAVEAMRDGAYDFLEKPFSPEALLGSLGRALEKRQLVLENRRLHEQADSRSRLDACLLGVSRSLQTLRRQVLELAQLPVNVLIRGETGSGKERVARCLHDFGPRSAKPFVALNCAAIPEPLFEAELFGHELLRVLQEQKLERLGSNQSIPVDLRIVAATKPDLLEESRAGRFREDLGHRCVIDEKTSPCCSNTLPRTRPSVWDAVRRH